MIDSPALKKKYIEKISIVEPLEPSPEFQGIHRRQSHMGFQHRGVS